MTSPDAYMSTDCSGVRGSYDFGRFWLILSYDIRPECVVEHREWRNQHFSSLADLGGREMDRWMTDKSFRLEDRRFHDV